MVAAAKLRKAQQRLMDARPYAQGLETILGHVAAQQDSGSHPLLEVREPENILYLVISSDRGLCGSFNANVNRRAQAEVDAHGDDVGTKLVTFGRKGSEFFTRREYAIQERFVNLLNDLEFSHAIITSNLLQKLYTSGEFDRVYAVHNWFKSAGTQEVLVKQLLPVEPNAPAAEDESHFQSVGFLYEPNPKAILDTIIPKNLNIQIWRMLLESYAAEQAARMVAMDSATDNAQEMIYQLSLSYNKARQAAITTEISEIVGGAEALQG